MEFVEPFKDLKEINSIKRYLKNHSERDFLLFVLGINTGLKINEMLGLKVCDVLDDENQIKLSYKVPGDAVNSDQKVPLNSKVNNALQHYLEYSGLQRDDYLFISAKSGMPISRQQAHRIIHDAVEKLGLQGRFGAGSMRKTFGYHAYKKGISISLIQKYFHHASPSDTFKYLGITKEEEGLELPFIDVNL